MKYYRVKSQFGNTKRTRFVRSMRQITDGEWKANELYTSVELRQLYPYPLEFPNIFEIVTISKNETFFYLGHRFQKNSEN